jgi:hypothetical protein
MRGWLTESYRAAVMTALLYLLYLLPIAVALIALWLAR